MLVGISPFFLFVMCPYVREAQWTYGPVFSGSWGVPWMLMVLGGVAGSGDSSRLRRISTWIEGRGSEGAKGRAGIEWD